MGNKRLYRLEHCTYTCQYHLVWATKWRGKVLSDTYIKAEFKRMFKQIAQWKGLVVRAWHVGDDHVHLHIDIPPKYSVAYVVQILKSKSSAWIKKKTKKYPRGTLWARGYFVSTVGADEHAVRAYVQNQHEHHASFQEQMFSDDKSA